MGKIKCRFCRSSRAVRRGFRYNRKIKRQLYACRNCGKKFAADDGFLKYRHDKKLILYATRLYNRYSSSEVQRMLKGKNARVSRWTIIKWSRKFG